MRSDVSGHDWRGGCGEVDAVVVVGARLVEVLLSKVLTRVDLRRMCCRSGLAKLMRTMGCRRSVAAF